MGPYIEYYGPYQVVDAVLKPLGVSDAARENISDWLCRMGGQRLADFLYSKRDRKIEVRIDRYDTWSMEQTLAIIILPMLIQLRGSKSGSPFVDDEDVPIELRSTSARPKFRDWDLDSNHFARWDWALDEMIYAFEKASDPSWEEVFYSGDIDLSWIATNPDETDKNKRLHESIERPNHTFKTDIEGIKKVRDRMQNGFLLFGKYYGNLWD